MTSFWHAIQIVYIRLKIASRGKFQHNSGADSLFIEQFNKILLSRMIILLLHYYTRQTTQLIQASKYIIIRADSLG